MGYKPRLKGNKRRFLLKKLYEDIQGQLRFAFSTSVEAIMPSLEIVVSPHRLQVNAPGCWWEDFTGVPVVFDIADVFLQIFRGSSALEAIRSHFDFFRLGGKAGP